MKKLFAAILFMSFIVSPSYSQEVVPGDVIVVLRNTPGIRLNAASSAQTIQSLPAVKSFTQSLNVNTIKTYDALSEQSGNIFMVVHSDTKNENDLLREVRANPNVVAASLNRVMHLCADERIPNDPEYYRLWGLEDINAPEVWNMSTGSDDVYVAVIDSGVDFDHEDLKDNFSHKYSRNFVGQAASGYDPSDYGDVHNHGSHVSGTIAAVGNNGKGVAGVNWKAKIIALRVFSASGHAPDSDIISAINYVAGLLTADPKLKIAAVNMSLGGFDSHSPAEMIAQSDPDYLALKILSDMNRSVICVAAGNETVEVGAPVMNDLYEDGKITSLKGCYVYPASYTGLDNMIAVGASTSTHERAYYSNYSNSFVHVAAPGGDANNLIFSTVRTNQDGVTRVFPYGGMGGTSMATPHVAGTAALLKAIYPDATASQIKAAILGGANSEYFTDDNTSMYGLLDIKGAVDFLADTLAENMPPKIAASSLHNPIAKQPYSFELKASGTEPITWSVEGELPAGLTLDESGHITGIPEKDGAAEFIITAENDHGSDSMVFTLSVDKGVPPVISTSGDISAYTGVSFDLTPRTDAGTWPILWSIAASDMPSGFGLSIDEDTGTITFTPQSAGTYHLTLKAENYAGEDTSELTVTAAAPLVPVIEDKTLKSGVVGMTYGRSTYVDAAVMLITGQPAGEFIHIEGTLPVSFDVSGLPKGLEFEEFRYYSISNPNGERSVFISGTPEEAGSFDVTVTAANAFGTVSRDFTLYVADSMPPDFSFSHSTYQMQAGFYSSRSMMFLGKPPLTFTTEGTLPEGIAMTSDDASVNFTGIPTTKGTYKIILFASNDVGTASTDLTFNVTDPAVITTNFLPEGVKGKAYSFPLASFGGVALTWTLSGDLPAGLRLSESGDISGTPTESGKFSLTIIAALNDSVSTRRIYTLIVRERPAVITASLPDGRMNTPYSRINLNAQGTAPITWSVAEGSLPAGLTLTANGYILGTPTESGIFMFTLRASNGAGQDSKTFTVNIASDGSDVNSRDITPASRDTTPVNPPSPDVPPTPTITTGSARGMSSLTLGEASAIAEEGGIVAAILPEISVSVSDFYTYSSLDVFADVKISDDVPAGYSLVWHPFTRTNTPAEVENAANDYAVFYDSEGSIITEVPADKIVNVSAWLEAGKLYAPVISAAASGDVPSAGPSSSGGGCSSGHSWIVLLFPILMVIHGKFREDR